MAFDKLYRFSVIFSHESGLPVDDVVNTWHWVRDSAVATDFDNVRDMLEDFYTTQYIVAAGSVGSDYSSRIANTVRVVAYNLEDPPPRVPAYSSTFNLPSRTGDPLPSEVALCMSYQANPVSGQPQARRRGRVYLGPFSEAINSSVGRPSNVAKIARAGRELLLASNSSTIWRWVVYSPTNDSWENVQSGWVDNAWDVQRRRGPVATSRTIWNTSTPT